MDIRKIHEKAVVTARELKTSEAKLVEVLQEVLEHQVFREMGYSSLHIYAVQALGLSDEQAYQVTRVARKAKEIPELKTAIDEGVLTVSQARRIVTVIEPETKREWIAKAATLKQRDLEWEVAKANPKEAVRERVRPLNELVAELRCSIPKEVGVMLERVKDLESQRTKGAAKLIDAIRAGCEAYLEKHDPVRRAARNIHKKSQSVSASRQTGRLPLPAQVKHVVHDRDKGQCTHVTSKGRRCESRRWLALHHVRPVSEGGSNTPENLTTLCFQHHQLRHAHDDYRAS